MPLVSKIVLEVLAMLIKEEKEIKSKWEKKKIKLSLFADDMILYIEKPKDVIRKPLELISEFSKIAGYKINAQKFRAFLYTNNEKKEIKEMIPFTVTSKRIKYLGINLPKEAKDLYSKNCKMLMNEMEYDTSKWKDSTIFLYWKNEYCQNDYITHGNLQIQCNPYQITSGIFHKTRTKIFLICMETQKTHKRPRPKQP